MLGFKKVAELSIDDCFNIMLKNDSDDLPYAHDVESRFMSLVETLTLREACRFINKHSEQQNSPLFIMVKERFDMLTTKEQREGTVIDRFPEYGFKPSSRIKKYSKSRIRTMTVIGGALIMIGALLLYWVTCCREPIIWGSLCGLLVCCGGVMLVLGAMMLKNKVWLIVDKADYISQSQKYGIRGNYCIFVKNNMFGVYMITSTKVVIPAKYDKLSWQTNSTLLAIKDDQTYIIDSHNGV